MGKGGEGRLAHPRQQRGKARVAAKVGAQHEVIEEEADERLSLGAVAAGDRRADHHVVLTAEAPEHQLDRRQQGHEQGASAAAAERLDLGGAHCRQPQLTLAAGEGLDRRPQPVQGQLERRRRPGERLAPVRHLLRQHLARQPLALPEREVGVLQLELEQRRRAAGGEGLVERFQLAQQQGDRPGVGGDVVEGRQHPMLAGGEPQQGHPEQLPRAQVEGRRRLGAGEPPRLRFSERIRKRGQVHHRQAARPPGRDRLHRPAVGQLEKGGAKRLMAAHDFGESRTQRADVEITGETHRRRHV